MFLTLAPVGSFADRVRSRFSASIRCSKTNVLFLKPVNALHEPATVSSSVSAPGRALRENSRGHERHSVFQVESNRNDDKGFHRQSLTMRSTTSSISRTRTRSICLPPFGGTIFVPLLIGRAHKARRPANGLEIETALPRKSMFLGRVVCPSLRSRT